MDKNAFPPQQGPSRMSSQDFLNYGSGQIVYLRTGRLNGKPACFLHDAAGKQVAAQTNADTAAALARQNGLEPLSLH